MTSYSKLYEVEKTGKESTNTAPAEKPSKRGR
jgi:hypothetical protein